MDTIFQALVMGIVQGLTEFLPVSSSGHLILVPWLFGWTDPFINSLAFSVMLHVGTLGALLIYFASDWIRLVPAGFAAIRDRSFRGDRDRKLAWLLLAATLPAAIAGYFLNDIFEEAVRAPGVVAVTLIVGGIVLWIADRPGKLVILGREIVRWGDGQPKGVGDVTFPLAFGLGVAQAIALVPGISRSGISISAARFAGLDRASATRFSFLMATPVIAGAALFEFRKLVSGESGVDVSIAPLLVGLVSAFLSGILAIRVLLTYVRTNSFDVFVVYRFVLAGGVLLLIATGIRPA
jgi:undecaprenyl-diphosphatase